MVSLWIISFAIVNLTGVTLGLPLMSEAYQSMVKTSTIERGEAITMVLRIMMILHDKS